jgi:integrase
LVDHGIAPVSLNATLTVLKFFIEVAADRPEAIARMTTVRVPRKLPVVLSRDEAARLITQLAIGEWIRDGLNALLVGPTGVGTWIACALSAPSPVV